MSEGTTTVDAMTDEEIADDDLLDRLEERYQTEQVLNDSAGVAATIEHAGWRDGANDRYVGAVCLHLSVPGGTEYSIVVPNIVGSERGEDFLSLVRWLEQSPQKDLSALEGESVAIDIVSRDDDEFVRIAAGDGLVHGQIVDNPGLVRGAPHELPGDVVAALHRAHAYRQADDGVSVRIADLGATEEELVLHLEDGWGTVRVPVERAYESTPQTAYEKLVEGVGGGSVKQIEGGSIYLTRATDMPWVYGTPFTELPDDEREDEYDSYVTATTDLSGEWVVFLDEPDRGLGEAFGFRWLTVVFLATAFMLFGAITGTLALGLIGVVMLVVSLLPVVRDSR